MMKAIIFAAGCSTRLGELTKDLPKCCLELRKGQTILQRTLTLLHVNNFQEVIIVTGFCADQIDKEVERWRGQFASMKTLFNSNYDERNNIYTAFIVREFIDSDTLILNSDLVFHPTILEIAVEEVHRSPKSFIVVDDRKKLVDEDMKILVDNDGKIVRIHKSLDNKSARGEYIGILRLAGKDLALFKESLEEMIERGDYGKYYEDAIDEKLGEMGITYLSTNGLPWVEVDHLADYKRAIEEVSHS